MVSYLEECILEVPVKIDGITGQQVIQTTLWPQFHQNTDIGRGAAGPHKGSQVLVTNVSHGLDLQSKLHVDWNTVSVQELDGHFVVVPLALVSNYIPGRKRIISLSLSLSLICTDFCFCLSPAIETMERKAMLLAPFSSDMMMTSA